MAWPRESRLSFASSGAACWRPLTIRLLWRANMCVLCLRNVLRAWWILIEKIFVGVHEKIFFDIFSANRTRLKQNSWAENGTKNLKYPRNLAPLCFLGISKYCGVFVSKETKIHKNRTDLPNQGIKYKLVSMFLKNEKLVKHASVHRFEIKIEPQSNGIRSWCSISSEMDTC